ncbi:MAG: hypothetical protein P1U34_05545 [Coxiellaceae bacterium]|nr:hypothetical protein [Coxiellaceae bacterium]
MKLNIKKRMSALLSTGLLCLIFSASLAGITAFTITPLTTNTTVTSVGEAAIQYTVTNNANSNIPSISVPNLQSSGANLSLSNDNCSGVTLPPSQSCTVDVTIPGSSQISNFTIRPTVCGFSGHLCSQSGTTASVTFIQHTLPIRVFQVIFALDGSSEQLVGINVANTSDIIRASISDPSRDGPLAISPDGSKVYMTHQNSDSTYSVLVFSVTATGLVQDSTSYSLSYQGSNLLLPGEIAITPSGDALYVTDRGYSGSGYPVYRVDLNSATVGALSDTTTGDLAQELNGIVISPDGTTVYVANSTLGSNPQCGIFSFANAATTTSISTVALQTDLATIANLLISSDGKYLYAGGESPTGDLPATIEQYNIPGGYSIENTFIPTPANNGDIISAALSPDNSKIYAVASNGAELYLYYITTAGMTAGAGETYPYNLIPFQSNFNYIAYSPDGSKVAMLNYGTSGNLTALFTPGSLSSAATVNPAEGGASRYSYTSGLFVN